jgi:uncharacterized protein YrzB (UPF0473 family)
MTGKEREREDRHHHHEGCGHDHDHEHDHDRDFEDDIFLVTDENGNELELVMVHAFDVGDRTYAVLIDRNQPDADGYIFRIEEDSESEDAYLADIEDDEEWERVEAAYNRLMEEDR